MPCDSAHSTCYPAEIPLKVRCFFTEIEPCLDSSTSDDNFRNMQDIYSGISTVVFLHQMESLAKIAVSEILISMDLCTALKMDDMRLRQYWRYRLRYFRAGSSTPWNTLAKIPVVISALPFELWQLFADFRPTLSRLPNGLNLHRYFCQRIRRTSKWHFHIRRKFSRQLPSSKSRISDFPFPDPLSSSGILSYAFGNFLNSILEST